MVVPGEDVGDVMIVPGDTDLLAQSGNGQALRRSIAPAAVLPEPGEGVEEPAPGRGTCRDGCRARPESRRRGAKRSRAHFIRLSFLLSLLSTIATSALAIW